MKVQFIKPFRKYKPGDVADMEGFAAEAVLRRKIAAPVKETKEEKRAYKKKGEKKSKVQ